MIKTLRLATWLSILTFFIMSCSQDPLTKGFARPPESAKPWVYWYWISDNISREGITRDLESMAAVGIGEAFIGNIYLENMLRGNVRALTPEWWGMVEHAIREGDRVGVKIGMFNCPGWSQSGGPWIKPEQSMRYVTYTEKKVVGPRRLQENMPIPKEPFQDIAVLAFPAPQADSDDLAGYSPRITCIPQVADAAKWVDGDLQSGAAFPNDNGLTIELNLSRAIAARSLLLYPGEFAFAAQCELQVIRPDKSIRTIRSFSFDRSNASINVGPIPAGPVAISFPLETSRKFRLVFSQIKKKAGLAEIRLSGASRLERFIEKQLGKMHPTPLPMWDAYLWPQQDEPEIRDLTIAADQVRDISDLMSVDGMLRWDVPEGEWIILRTGMTPTGTKNSPASPEAQGLEVDKMNRQAAQAHFDAYMGEIIRRMPAAQRKALSHVVADSYEMGSQNWTDGFREDFIQRYGYDPQKWLPVFTGRIIGSADQSDRFLWDLRRLVADRVSRDYVGGLADISHRNGLKLWLENYGHWGYPAEFLQYGGQADQISGEFWATGELGSIELRAASSASHIYGMPITSAEAFTGGPHFVSHPYSLKRRGDWAYTQGINHFVLHVYIHQPWQDRKPGMNAWFGTEFNRHNTWFQPGKAWFDYFQRCHFMLQQGLHVADIAYFIGEDVPKMTGVRKPDLPPGYDFDYINAEAILNRLQVKGNRFILPDGMSYAVLVLPELQTMRPAVLQKLSDLVAEGGTILGAPPQRSPSMHNYPVCDEQVKAVANTLWQNCDGIIRQQAVFGKGRVFRNVELTTVLKELGIVPDFYGPDPKQVLWTHRSAKDADIYFLTNQSDQAISIAPVFRVQKKQPEFWLPENNGIFVTARLIQHQNGIKTPIELDARGSVFVVFRKSIGKDRSVIEVTQNGRSSPLSVERLRNGDLQAMVDSVGCYQFRLTDGRTQSIDVSHVPASLALDGPWQVQFPAGMDAPEKTTFASLISWTDHTDPGIKYFSGTALYQKTMEILPSLLAENKIWQLDLGTVGMLAEVIVNDKNLGVLWKPPYAVDVSQAIKPGSNTLTIKVTNVWKNRLMGDSRFPHGFLSAMSNESGKNSNAFNTFLAADIKINPEDELLPSGLIGPVLLKSKLVVRIP